jgi:two-component system OmpR family sensor kinase
VAVSLGLRHLGLRGRLVAATTAAAVVAVAVLVVGLQVLLAHQTDQSSLAALRSRADAAASTIRFTDAGITVLETTSDSLDQNIWVYDADAHRVQGSSPPRRLREAIASLGNSTTERTSLIHGRFRLLARPVRNGGRTRAVVVAGLDLDPYEESEQRGLALSLGLGLLTVLAAGGAAWAASRQTLLQVRRMARRADDWREHDLSGRFDLGPGRDELTELGDTLDRMLDRITQAILAERRLTDEVAHELRTPLAVIRSEAQLAQLETRPGAVPAESLEAIVSATDRMIASITTMLSVSRSVHGDEQRCRPEDVLEHLRLHAVHRDGVTLDVASAPRAGDRDVVVAAPLGVVGAAATPLLDNAVRHARSRVQVRVTCDDRRVDVHVEDDGDGIDPARSESIFLAGHSTAPDGAGLGLPLARRLAHSVGGEVRARSEDHGHFVLSLPRD